MKLLVVVGLLAVAAAAAPQNSYQDIQLTRSDSDNDGQGTYNFVYEQSDGHRHEQHGELKNAGTDDEALVMTGSYSWMGPDGLLYTVTYTADETGFHPIIEQPPGGAVPDAVVASLLG